MILDVKLIVAHVHATTMVLMYECSRARSAALRALSYNSGLGPWAVALKLAAPHPHLSGTAASAQGPAP
jgi:hypothetical protein